MLALSLYIGTEHFAVPVAQVAEVLPLTGLQAIPLAPDYIAGLLDYHGTPVPVIDLCALMTGNAHHKVLTTRMILIHYRHAQERARLLGLIAERVTETLQIPDAEIRSTGVSLHNAPYLGRVSKQADRMTQLINADALLTDEVHQLLYQPPASGVSA
ncbi:MAG: chemotaxis protein CheW [Gammaproteobacteria bacterium]